MSRRDDILEKYRNGEEFDIDVKLYSDMKIQFYRGGASFRVDTIYLTYEPWDNEYPYLRGFAHSDNGDYNWDYIGPDDVTNMDLYAYMQDSNEPWNITNFEGLMNDHPEIFYF